VIYDLLKGIEGVLPDPAPWVYASELAPSSVNLTVYYWVESQQANVLKVSDQVVTGIKQALGQGRASTCPSPTRWCCWNNSPTDRPFGRAPRPKPKRLIPTETDPLYDGGAEHAKRLAF
jgi:hypothetical protein